MAHGNDGIGCGAAAGHLAGVACQRVVQCLLLIRIHQGHDTLVDVHSGQKLIIYGEFHVHQGIADGVDVVFIHEIGYLLTGACGW